MSAAAERPRNLDAMNAELDKRLSDSIAAVNRGIDDLLQENAAVRDALSLAVNMLAPLEPGDSRAVSDEFVALASVACGDMRQEVMDIIRARLSAPPLLQEA